MSEIEVHFHSGPYAGESYIVARPLPHWFDVDKVVGEKRWLGRYRQDPDSAGGRCFDWVQS